MTISITQQDIDAAKAAFDTGKYQAWFQEHPGDQFGNPFELLNMVLWKQFPSSQKIITYPLHALIVPLYLSSKPIIAFSYPGETTDPTTLVGWLDHLRAVYDSPDSPGTGIR